MNEISRREYFLKVEEMLLDCEEIQTLKKQKHGSKYLWMWMRLAFSFSDRGGVLFKKVDNRIIPITWNDIISDFKGVFTDTEIKEGFGLLETSNLIYTNTNGYKAITGLTACEDSKEPVLHLKNSNIPAEGSESARIDTLGTFYENEHHLKRNKGVGLDMAPPDFKMLSYTEMAEKAKCNKQTVINYIRKLNLGSKTERQGRQKVLPTPWALLVIYTIQKKPIPPDLIDQIRKLDRGYLIHFKHH